MPRGSENEELCHGDGSCRRATGLHTARRTFRKCYLAVRSLPKTLLFNLWYFPPLTAVRIPVVVSHRVSLFELGGRVSLGPEPRFGMVRLGFGSVGIFDQARRRSIWEVRGQVHFAGRCNLGHGTKVSVAESGCLRFGANSCVNAESAICCRHTVSLGEGALVSWDVLIMDTDYHRLETTEGQHINGDEPVSVGDHVWIGCRTTVLKGATLAAHTVVAAGSVVTSATPVGEHSVVGGVPARRLADNVVWR